MSMKSLLKMLDKKTVREQIPVEKKITGEAEANPKLPIYFPNFPGGPLVINLWATRKRIGKSLGVGKEKIIDHLAEAVDSPVSTKDIEDPPIKKNSIEDFDLHGLPIPKYYPNDGGRYITSGVVFAEVEGVRNLSFHRMMLRDETSFTIRLCPRHLEEMYEVMAEKGNELDISIAIGLCPAILLAGATSVDYETDELKIASSLREKGVGERVETTKLDNRLLVPAHAEYVLEGRITLDKETEGPFVDITGTYDKARQQPVVEIDKIWHKDDPVFHALLPGGQEHYLLMGLPRESMIKREINKVADVKNVRLTEGGSSWLHGIISINKKDEDDIEEIIKSAFKAHSSMKKVTIVDDDIDIFDDSDVEWAVATRFQPHKDLTILEDQEGSSLDPSAPDMTSKWGLDATKPWKGKEFEKASLL